MGLGMFDSERDEDRYRSTGSIIFGPKMGTWTLHSYKDTRWNKSGRAMGLISTGGPKELRDWIKSCKEKYGDCPEDLEWSFWKD